MREPPLSTTKSRPSPDPHRWAIPGRSISLVEPVVVGILNLTPDSFSDGGELPTLEAAILRAELMVRDGAGILDVGGESTRPGALAVSMDEELRRVLPVVEALVAGIGVPVSVDTRKAGVAEAALAAGACIVNDVSALAFDPEMADVVARAGAGVVLMHMRGTPEDMRDRTEYADLVAEVVAELGHAVHEAQRRGVRPEAIVLDPGIGFAKTSPQSAALLGQIARLRELGFPVMVGPSRKSFLGDLLNVPPPKRAVGTAAACLVAYQGGARLFRVHDVAPTVQALAVAQAIAVEQNGSESR